MESHLLEEQQLDELVKAFHLMWDHFPEPACLTHKSYRVVAVNPVGAQYGRLPGNICIQEGGPEAHKGCLAAPALKEQKARYARRVRDGKESLAYWLPVEGYPEYFLHFGTRITMDYE